MNHPSAELPSSASTASPRPEILIRPKAGWQAIDLGELWRFRELLYFLVWRDMKVRYKQTVLGATWAVLQPLALMLVFWIFFGKLGGLEDKSALPYPLLIFPALLPWMFFANSVSQGGSSLVNSAHLISKVYFPRLLIPLSSLGAPLVDLLISFLVLLMMLGGYLLAGEPSVSVGASLVWLPLFLAGTFVATLGVATLFSALTIAYRDFRHLLAFAVQIWFFVTPVSYPLSIIPEKWRLVYALNPMTGMVVGFRGALTGEAIPWDLAAVSAASSALFFYVGVKYFRRIERRFADII